MLNKAIQERDSALTQISEYNTIIDEFEKTCNMAIQESRVKVDRAEMQLQLSEKRIKELEHEITQKSQEVIQ